LETVKDKLEERDEAVLNRDKIFAAVDEEPEKKRDEQEEEADLTKFKKVSFELLDIGVHYGQ
jgi:hypothetical protein